MINCFNLCKINAGLVPAWFIALATILLWLESKSCKGVKAGKFIMVFIKALYIAFGIYGLVFLASGFMCPFGKAWVGAFVVAVFYCLLTTPFKGCGCDCQKTTVDLPKQCHSFYVSLFLFSSMTLFALVTHFQITGLIFYAKVLYAAAFGFMTGFFSYALLAILLCLSGPKNPPAKIN